MSNIAATLAQVSFMMIEDNKGDAAQAGDRVKKNSAAIDVKRNQTVALTDDLRGLQDDAKEMHEKAADTSAIGRVFGVRGSREKKADALEKDATSLEGKVEVKAMESEALRDDSEEKLDQIKTSNEDSADQSAFLNKALARAFVVSP